jgi:AraC-like DNA-binding protein
MEKHPLADSHRICADFYNLCSIFSSLRKQTYTQSDSRITAAKEYLDSHFTEAGCLDGAAGICGVSRRRFCDIFVSRCGITPGRYVTVQRTEYAKKLLSSKELSVGNVAELCGFSDVYYFSKVFKREVGVPPSEYL